MKIISYDEGMMERETDEDVENYFGKRLKKDCILVIEKQGNITRIYRGIERK